MTYEVECDDCPFAETVAESWEAYGSARDHEAEHPTHVVSVLRPRAP